MTRETVAINFGRGGNEWHRRPDLRLGPPLSARDVQLGHMRLEMTVPRDKAGESPKLRRRFSFEAA